MDSTIETIKRLAIENQELKYELAKVKPLLLMGDKLLEKSEAVIQKPDDVSAIQELTQILEYFKQEFLRKKVS